MAWDQLAAVQQATNPTYYEGDSGAPVHGNPISGFNVGGSGYNYAPAGDGTYWRFAYDPSAKNPSDYAGRQYQAVDSQGNVTGTGILPKDYGTLNFQQAYLPFALMAGGMGGALAGAGAFGGAGAAGSTAGGIDSASGVLNGAVMNGAGTGAAGTAAGGAGAFGGAAGSTAGGIDSAGGVLNGAVMGGGANAAGAAGTAAGGAVGAGGAGSGVAGAGTTAGNFLSRIASNPSSWVGPAASLLGGAYAANAAKGAANTQAQSARDALGVEQNMFNKVVDLNEPFRQGGVAGMNALTTALGLSPGDNSGWAMKDFTPSDLTTDPSYQWRLQQGQQAIERGAAARGGLYSGRAAKDLTNYAQGAASQEYQNAFNRYQTSRAAKLAPLQSLAGVGQSAAGTVGNAAQNYGTNASNLITGAGNAQAAGQVGAANAYTSAIGQGMSAYQNNNLMNLLMSRQPGSNYAG